MFKITLYLFYVLLLNCVYGVDFNYHNYSEVTTLLKEWTTVKHHEKIRLNLYSIGKSVQGRELWVLELTAGLPNDTSLPNVKLIGNMHGNEVVGRELLLHYIEFLLSTYSMDEEITYLLDHTKIHIMPSINPDGFESIGKVDKSMCNAAIGRENARKVDLNRNFPDYYRKNRQPIQPETQAMMLWLQKVPFILSVALHGGALVANYPFDTMKNFKSSDTSESSLSPDNDVFVHLAKTYANNHESMYKGLPCENIDKKFEHGITNGAAWYAFPGGMQDYNYFKHGCMELTVEISCCKYPLSQDLPGLWKANKKAFVKYCLQANQGVTGTVLDKVTKEPINATLKIQGRNMEFHNDINGRFWRLLLPGTYNISVSADGYHKDIKRIDIPVLKKYPKLVEIEIFLLNSSIPLSTTTTLQSTVLTTPSHGERSVDDAPMKDLVISSESEAEPMIGSVISGCVKIPNMILMYFILCVILVA